VLNRNGLEKSREILNRFRQVQWRKMEQSVNQNWAKLRTEYGGAIFCKLKVKVC